MCLPLKTVSDRKSVHTNQSHSPLVSSADKGRLSVRTQDQHLTEIRRETVRGRTENFAENRYRGKISQNEPENGNWVLSILPDVIDLSKLSAREVRMKQTPIYLVPESKSC
jgi:hypothetical protein